MPFSTQARPSSTQSPHLRRGCNLLTLILPFSGATCHRSPRFRGRTTLPARQGGVQHRPWGSHRCRRNNRQHRPSGRRTNRSGGTSGLAKGSTPRCSIPTTKRVRCQQKRSVRTALCVRPAWSMRSTSAKKPVSGAERPSEIAVGSSGSVARPRDRTAHAVPGIRSPRW